MIKRASKSLLFWLCVVSVVCVYACCAVLYACMRYIELPFKRGWANGQQTRVSLSTRKWVCASVSCWVNNLINQIHWVYWVRTLGLSTISKRVSCSQKKQQQRTQKEIWKCFSCMESRTETILTVAIPTLATYLWWLTIPLAVVLMVFCFLLLLISIFQNKFSFVIA